MEGQVAEEEEDEAQYFPLLKSRAKVHQQDMIWRQICEEVGFNFQKSIS